MTVSACNAGETNGGDPHHSSLW